MLIQVLNIFNLGVIIININLIIIKAILKKILLLFYLLFL